MEELKISSFNTIYGTNFDEMFVDDFLKEMEKNIDADDYSYNVIYNKENFIIVYKGRNFTLSLDKITMEQYAFGKYNAITFKLKELIDKKQKINNLVEIEKNELNDREKIIRDAEEKNLIPNNYAKEVYIEYLKDCKRFTMSDIKKSLFDFFLDIVYSNDDVNNLIWKKRYPFKMTFGDRLGKVVYVLFSLFFGFVPFMIYFGITDVYSIDFNFVYALLFSLIPSSTLLVPITTFFCALIKNRFLTFKKNIYNRKILKNKIKQLTKELNNDNLQSLSIKAFDKTFENSIKEDLYNFKDQIMNDINKLVDRLDYINSNDRFVLLKELQDILNEYIERINNIENQDKSNKLQLDKDNILKLKMDTIRKIVSVESRMLDIRMKDIVSDEREQEQLLLEEKIDNCYINMDDINKEVARREGNKERVLRQQRTSKVNRRHI